MNLPNKLTVLRLILVLVMIIIFYIPIEGTVWDIQIKMIILDVIFAIASYTDHLDGKIARKRNLITDFGKFLDPIADKILVITALIMLVACGQVTVAIPAIIIFREFAVSGYRLIASSKKGEVIAANIWGKVKTVTQILAILFAFIDVGYFGQCFTGTLDGGHLAINIITFVLLIVCTIATIFSGWNYLKNGKDLLKDM